MRAVVVYESMYGNTHLVADAIGAGLGSACDVSVIPVSHADPGALADADLLVVGGPTHAHGMSRSNTRASAVEMASRPATELEVEEDAAGPGLRDWFGSLGQYHAKAAAFDTRLHGPGALTGRASRGIGRLLREHGFDMVGQAESFLVTRQNKLDPGERDRAREWGSGLAAALSAGRAEPAQS